MHEGGREYHNLYLMIAVNIFTSQNERNKQGGIQGQEALIKRRKKREREGSRYSSWRSESVSCV